MESGKVSFKSVIDNLWKTTQQVLKEVAVREASKTEVIRRGVQRQQTVIGKDLLWKIAPFAFGGLVLIMVLRFK